MKNIYLIIALSLSASLTYASDQQFCFNEVAHTARQTVQAEYPKRLVIVGSAATSSETSAYFDTTYGGQGYRTWEVRASVFVPPGVEVQTLTLVDTTKNDCSVLGAKIIFKGERR